MDLTYEDNTQTAVDPQAIQTAPPQKLPIYDNDPTRDISPHQRARRVVLIGFGAVALLVMFVVTVLALAER